MRIPSIHLARNRHSMLGMDFGADGVRLVSMRHHGDQFEVDWAEEISLTELQGFADYDSVSDRLAEVLSPRLRGRVQIATVPPWNSARAVIEEMPAMESSRFHQASHWYFENHPQEDMLDPVNRGIPQAVRTNADGKDVVDGIMVSLDQVMLTGLVDMCQRLELRLDWLVPSSLCFPALLRAEAHPPQQVLFVDIGANQSRMALSSDGIVRLVRRLKPSANDIVRDLGDKLQLGWVEANHALLAHSGLGPLAENDEDGIAARAHDAIERGLDRLADSLRGEILRSAAYVEARHGEQVERVALAGGLGGAPGLIERLQEALEIPLVAIDPLQGSAAVASIPEPARTRYSLAAGAAILALEANQDANLLLAERAPAPERRRASARRAFPVQRIAGLAVGIGLIAGVAAHDVMVSREIARREAAYSQLSEEEIALKVRARELTAQENLFEIEDQIESLRDIYRSRHLFTPFFTEVVTCLPDAMRLDHAAITRGVRDTSSTRVPLEVELRGRTRDVDAIGDFVVQLEERKLLSRIEILRIHEIADSEASRETWFRFELGGEPVVLRQEEFIAAHESAQSTRPPTVDTDIATEVAR